MLLAQHWVVSAPDWAENVSDSNLRTILDKHAEETDIQIDRLQQILSDAGEEGEQSSTAVRAKIRKLVGGEHPDKPLSDSQIAEILSAGGITVARRTVAKYREAMKIPSSSDRKRSRSVG